MIKRFFIRGIVGIIAGAIIGLTCAALLMSSVPDQWIETWKTETGLQEHHIAWLLWGSIAFAVVILSMTFGGIYLGRRAAFITRGILCGCLIATVTALGAAWFSDEWPFRVKAPQTSIAIGRSCLLPACAIIGGLMGQYLAARRDRKNEKPQNNGLHASSVG